MRSRGLLLREFLFVNLELNPSFASGSKWQGHYRDEKVNDWIVADRKTRYCAVLVVFLANVSNNGP